MKETGTEHWLTPKTEATNEAGFRACGVGWRNGDNGGFTTLGLTGRWWTSQETSPDRANWREIYYNSGSVYPKAGGKPNFGMSIRCVKDL